jgi:hypothetical protein
MKTPALILSTVVATLSFGGGAHASSDEAWAEFASDVEKACITAASSLIDDGRAVVDPFGSEHYGLAVISGRASGAAAEISTICVYDKQKKTAEVGGEISAEQLVAKP